MYRLHIINIHKHLVATSTEVQIASVRWQIEPPPPPVLSRGSSRPTQLTLPLTPEDTLPNMSQYLHPLSVPSRHNSTCDESPYSSSQSSPSAACTTPCTAQPGHHFLNIPGLQTQQSIKDADGVDKLANAALSQGRFRRKGGNTLGTYYNHRNHTLRYHRAIVVVHHHALYI